MKEVRIKPYVQKSGSDLDSFSKNVGHKLCNLINLHKNRAKYRVLK